MIASLPGMQVQFVARLWFGYRSVSAQRKQLVGQRHERTRVSACEHRVSGLQAIGHGRGDRLQSPRGAEQVRIFQEEGVQMDRVSIGHTADSTDLAYLERLLNTGVYLTMDRYPGRNSTWEQRNATVKALIDRGWGSRIMLGHDGFAAAWVWAGRDAPRGGTSAQANPDGMLFVSRKAIPALLQDGVSPDAITLMTRENPRRFLTGED